jgi:hypothetical protein
MFRPQLIGVREVLAKPILVSSRTYEMSRRQANPLSSRGKAYVAGVDRAGVANTRSSTCGSKEYDSLGSGRSAEERLSWPELIGRKASEITLGSSER